jgi:MtN3 and saliva related transmembrane protein
MDQIMAIGLIAGFLTTISFLPQVIKTWRSRSAHDLSYAMLVIFLIGIGLWTWYGIFIESLPIMVANVSTIVLIGFLILMKVRFEKA